MIRSMSSLCDGNRDFEMCGSRAGEYFQFRRGLIQGCVMSPWVFNVCFDRVVRLMNKRVTGGGEKLRDGNGGVVKNDNSIIYR